MEGVETNEFLKEIPLLQKFITETDKELYELLKEEKVSLDQFCDFVQRRKGQASFSSTMRAQILEYFRRR